MMWCVCVYDVVCVCMMWCVCVCVCVCHGCLSPCQPMAEALVFIRAGSKQKSPATMPLAEVLALQNKDGRRWPSSVSVQREGWLVTVCGWDAVLLSTSKWHYRRSSLPPPQMYSYACVCV